MYAEHTSLAGFEVINSESEDIDLGVELIDMGFEMFKFISSLGYWRVKLRFLFRLQEKRKIDAHCLFVRQLMRLRGARNQLLMKNVLGNVCFFNLWMLKTE
ncbi:hypothetical protein LguiB_026367 [Lonicera macranthoides]